MIRAIAIALAVIAGCDKAPSKLDPTVGAAKGSAAGSAVGSADPWTGSGSAAAGSAADCPDDVIAKKLDDSFAAIDRYFGAMSARVPGWKDCEKARTDLIALAPDAQQFEAAVTETKSWAEGLGTVCRDRLKEFGQTRAAAQAADAEKKYGPLEGSVKEALERCKDHPGFQDAAKQGLRVMRKKS